MTKMMKRGLAVLVAWGLFGSGSTTATAAYTAPEQPKAGGKRGDIYLSMSGSDWTGWGGKSVHRGKFAPAGARKKPQRMPRKVSLVQVMNDRGQVVENVPAPFSSGEVVFETLKQELTEAGFRVTVVRELTGSVGRGIDVSFVASDLKQTSGLLALNGSCRLQVTLDIWQKGMKRQSQQYSASTSGYSVAAGVPFDEIVAAAAQQVAEQALAGM